MTDVYMANILENNKNVSQRNTTYYEFASKNQFRFYLLSQLVKIKCSQPR